VRRSNKENRYYRGVLVKEATEHYANNIGDLIRDVLLATKAAPTEDFVHSLFKMMFNKGRSTTILMKGKDVEDDDRYQEYIFKIRDHFLHAHQVRISEPNEIPLAGE